MKELEAILNEARRLHAKDAPFALATVVKINGSTYRRPGARMLIGPDGTTTGTISGGCLEQEVAQQALQIMDDGTPRVEEFDLSDDDLILGFGIGCDGTVHVLIEPAPDAEHDPLRWIERALDRRERGLIATVIGAEGQPALLGQRLLAFADGTTDGAIDAPAVTTAVRKATPDALAEAQPQILTVASPQGPAEVLLEIVEPPVHLHVFGGGHDVQPVVRVARELGWPVTVIGSKAEDELARTFPEADAHVFLMNPEAVRDYVTLDERSPAVIMNHNYERDKTLVQHLLPAPAPYVGALGPRRRTERIMEELREADPELTPAHFEKLHGPVGLDIGTETPQEIALAIVAEIQAVLHDRPAQKLREREGAIHERVPTA